ncbi:hypothetical protein [Cohnella thailandensis]|uniref:RCK N-terminal domain-containing protein n=1 Tax=Cohnella thailandensis TaxID=557557 RepID=A0A841SYH6_9BACL|nr:hypothetical protein [Cohnella thailandensis]MBB6635275.1 hypothetical protein [Cohnella thailandensis]MBP1974650.1 ribonucleotide monophosphatase NagD (HAD superfamily) [Cohnella thailandensis]
MAHRDVVLLSAPTLAGEQFARLLRNRNIPFAAIVNNGTEFERLCAIGAEKLIRVDTSKREARIVPSIEVGKVYLFERSLNLSCRYLQICRDWTTKPIYVITESSQPRHIYKALGADYVIHSQSIDLSFLVTDDLNAMG